MTVQHLPIPTAFFGRSHEGLSTRGLAILLGEPGIEVISVTPGRAIDSAGTGELEEVALGAGIEIRSFQEVRRNAAQPELVVSFSNPVVFPPTFIGSVRWGVVNLHPGPLPEYRGCHSLEHALLEGAAEFGATLHFCAHSIDSGPIIDETRFPIDEDDTSSTLWEKVDRTSLALLDRNLARIVRAARQGRRVPAQAQDEGRARYFAHDSLPAELELDPNAGWPALVRQVRAYDHPRRRPAYLACDEYALRFRYRDRQVVLDTVDPRRQEGQR